MLMNPELCHEETQTKQPHANTNTFSKLNWCLCARTQELFDRTSEVHPRSDEIEHPPVVPAEFVPDKATEVEFLLFLSLLLQLLLSSVSLGLFFLSQTLLFRLVLRRFFFV